MNIFNQFTLRTLRKNKIRTLVTVVGIALSVAMFTAVTSSIASFQQYLLNMEVIREGAWEGRMIATDLQSIQNITADKRVKDWTQMDNLGYAELKDCTNDDKPYLMIEAVDKDFTKYSPITLLEGRMPKDSSEIVISKHLEYNGGVTYTVLSVGDVSFSVCITTLSVVLSVVENSVSGAFVVAVFRSVTLILISGVLTLLSAVSNQICAVPVPIASILNLKVSEPS